MKKLFILSAVLMVLVGCNKGQIGNNYAPPVPYKVEPAFTPLPYGAIEPTYWLREWSETAKDGLVLNNPALEEGWFEKQPTEWKSKQAPYWVNDIKYFKKSWLEGQPPFTLNEQTAYWIDGMLRLGIALHDRDLLARATKDIRTVIDNRYLAPGGWSSSIYQRAIMAYYQNTKDTSALNYLNDFLKTTVFVGFSGAEIWTEFLSPERMAVLHATEPRDIVQTETMFETYSFTGDTVLLNHALSNLKPHENHFVNFWNGKYSEDCDLISPNGCVHKMHGVSYNEMAKLWAIAYLYNGDTNYLKASVNAYKLLDSLHMMPHGVNSAMENIAGVDATIPTETCDVSDYINSVTWLYRITGKASYGDRIEKAFFNAAPAAVDADYKKHVYFQAPNCLSLTDKWAFQELHDPLCCSGNQARLLPNYLLHMLMATNDRGLAFNLYGPCNANVLVGDKTKALVEVKTNYPFEEAITLKVSPEKPVKFPFYFRIPAWATEPSIMVNGEFVPATVNEAGFVVVDRKWNANDIVVLRFPHKAKIIKSVTTTNNATGSVGVTITLKAIAGTPYATVEYGPLLFSLKVEKGDAYNFALTNDSLQVEYKKYAGKWSWGNAPIEIAVNAEQFNWDNAPALPLKKVASTGNKKKIVLVPYGSTHGTRISMFPFIDN